MITVRKRVASGIELLDEFGPENWRELVDIETLSFPDQRLCVLGQLYGTFVFGLNELRKNVEFFSYDRGFLASETDDYDQLTKEWKRQLHS